MISDEDAVET